MWKDKPSHRGLLAGSLSGLVLALGLVASPAAAGVHDNIVLKNHAGELVTDLTGTTQLNNAFSVKTTCFGAAGCHGDASATNNLKFTYDNIEKHSYHAQLAANAQMGWNPMNPDGNAWESGPSPKGKNWVQGQGHMGAW